MNIDEDTLRGCMSILSITKLLYDHGKLNRLFEFVGSDLGLNWDDQALVEQYACECVFQDTKVYFHSGNGSSRPEYEYDRMVYVLRDPLLNRFEKLCREYEARHGISRTENKYAKQMEDTIHEAMQLANYCYDYRWIDGTKDKKGPKFLIFIFEEFYSFAEIPGALYKILDGCEYEIGQLEKKLAQPPDKAMPLPAALLPEQEAA